MAYEDFITSVLNVKTDDIEQFSTEEDSASITLNVKLKDKHPVCPLCGFSCEIKEYKKRIYTHLPIVRKSSCICFFRRRYRCKDCGKTFSEENPFGPENYHISYAVLFSIVNDLKCAHNTFSDIALKHRISPSLVSLYADSFLRVGRLPLPENMGLDEISSAMAQYGGSYLCVMVDNNKRVLNEILPDRSKRTLSRYFESISKEERERVKYLTIDMWQPYKDVAELYLPNCEIAVDPFHVIEHLMKGFDSLRISLQKQTIYNSPAYYLLKKWHWLLTSDIDLDNEPKYNGYFKRKMNYKDLYNMLINLNEDLRNATILVYRYRLFNKECTYEKAEEQLNALIDDFQNSHLACFEEFVSLLKHWKKEIINSFRVMDSNRRQSNALCENINSRLRELLTVSHGFASIERFRSRAIYCLNDTIYCQLSSHLNPKFRTGKKRGPYHKEKQFNDLDNDDGFIDDVD